MAELPMSLSSSHPITGFLLPRTGEAEVSEPALPLEHEIIGLFDLLRAPLLRYAISLGLSVHDGEDIIQEVFLALFHHLKAGRPQSHLRGWVFRVTHNLALKRRARNQSHYRQVEEDCCSAYEYTDPSPSPEEEFLFSERQAKLRAVVDALPERDQWCLRLRAEGLRYREISEVLGLSLGSVSNSLVRSLARLERMDKR
jgi:RNA polymerase sigma-70 factor (ECF subfamily)